MDLPRQYPYKPKWILIVWLIGAGVAWIALQYLECNCRPHTFSLVFGLAPIGMGLLMAVHRFAFDHYLVLETEALVLPTGFFQVQTTRIPYVRIESVWQSFLPMTAIIRISTKDGKFQIPATLLPNKESYLGVGNFLYSQAQKNMKSPRAEVSDVD